MVRTPGFHPGNRGSIPRGDASKKRKNKNSDFFPSFFKKMIILGIETSCDESAVAIAQGQNDKVKILSDFVFSQINIHKKYGGVVPEVAAREHVLQIIPTLNKALKKAGINQKNFSKKINGIAVTTGPGLISSLMVGVETAKILSYVFGVPLLAPNHIESHIYANFINLKKSLPFPMLALTVSGGHTMLILMKKHNDFKIIGETLDDAAGEAFDKTAKLLDIGYPGGPLISAYAQKFKKEKKITLPRPMKYKKNFNFSFSGLKTAVRYKIEKDKNWQKNIEEYCHETEEAIVDVLTYKTIKASQKYKAKSVVLAGGVSANQKLRKRLEEKVKKELNNVVFNMPDLKYTTDNAAMVASAGYFHFKNKLFVDWKKIKTDPNLAL